MPLTFTWVFIIFADMFSPPFLLIVMVAVTLALPFPFPFSVPLTLSF
jgi:hypothetical protein